MTNQPTPKKLGYVDTISGASRALTKTVKTIRTWRAEGGESAGFLPDGRINLDVLKAWSDARTQKRKGKVDTAEKIKIQQELKLRLANQRTQGRLVECSWVAQQFQLAAAEIQAFRLKSESEHPTRFAAAAGDVPACRTVIQEIWDEILRVHQASIAKHLEAPVL